MVWPAAYKIAGGKCFCGVITLALDALSRGSGRMRSSKPHKQTQNPRLHTTNYLYNSAIGKNVKPLW